MPKMTSMVLAIILAALAMARHQIMVSAIPMQKSPFLISMFGSTRMANAFLMPAWLLVNIAVAMIRLRESGTLCISSEILLYVVPATTVQPMPRQSATGHRLPIAAVDSMMPAGERTGQARLI